VNDVYSCGWTTRGRTCVGEIFLVFLQAAGALLEMLVFDFGELNHCGDLCVVFVVDAKQKSFLCDWKIEGEGLRL
jgi:hypothetical protein